MTRISQKLNPGPGTPGLSSRRYVTRKRSLLALSLSFVFLLVCEVTGAAGHVADKMILYVHLAGLYAKSPDTNLSMPLKDVKKSHIANTWHAARGERQHEGQDILVSRGRRICSGRWGLGWRLVEANFAGTTVSVFGVGGGR